MADVHNPKTRSYNMSMIKSRDTKPEIEVRRYLHSCGFRYRLHVTKLPGKPDMVFPRYKTVIFVNGCFWHGHDNCKYFRLPDTRTEWWKNKIEATNRNDLRNATLLNEAGYRVITIWECEIKNKKYRKSIIEDLIHGV